MQLRNEVNLGSGVLAGFTTRWGGVSEGNYGSNNLGAHVGDVLDAVGQNRQQLSAQLGGPLVFIDQVHGTKVHRVRSNPGPGIWQGGAADAQVTTVAGVTLVVMVADCIPILLADAQAGVVAVAHAGRAGLRAGVIQETLAAMLELGAQSTGIRAVLGPAICGTHYEVPAEMATEFAHEFPGATAVTPWNSAGLDLRAGAHQIMVAQQITQVSDVAHCTYEDVNYFSHRRDGGAQHTGRFVGYVKLLAD